MASLSLYEHRCELGVLIVMKQTGMSERRVRVADCEGLGVVLLSKGSCRRQTREWELDLIL